MIFNDTHYASFIENLSEQGIYVVTTPGDTSMEFPSDSPVSLKFEIPSGSMLELSCRIKWSYNTPPHGLTKSIGMEIIDTPAEYLSALDSFS